MRYLILIIVVCSFGTSMVSCGSKETEIVYEDNKPAVPYNFEILKSKCSKCHPSSAPALPTDEAGWKASAKIKSEITSGDMPKGSQVGFDKAAALKFLGG